VVDVPAPTTAIARCRSVPGGLVVELVDLAGDDEVLGRVRASLPPGHSAVIDGWEGAPACRDRLLAALADELRARGRRRATRTFGPSDGDESRVLASLGFVELRREDGRSTWILDL
jgi:hypothetical protein